MTKPLALIAAGLLLWSCAAPQQPQGAAGAGSGPVEQYALEGTVVRLDETGRIATVKHGPIHDAKGALWMEAMTMEYPVPDEDDFGRLRRGQAIRATIHSRPSDYSYWLADIKPQAAAAPAAPPPAAPRESRTR